MEPELGIEPPISHTSLVSSVKKEPFTESTFVTVDMTTVDRSVSDACSVLCYRFVLD